MALTRYCSVVVSGRCWRGFKGSASLTGKQDARYVSDNSNHVGNLSSKQKFRQKFKEIVAKVEAKEKWDFHSPKKVFSRTENNRYTKLMQADTDDGEELILSEQFDREFWTSQKVLLELAKQHSYYIELPGRLEYHPGDFDQLTKEELLLLLQVDSQFRFTRKKSFWKHKKLKEREIAPRLERESFIPTIDLVRWTKKMLMWRLMPTNSEMPVVFDMGFDSKMRPRDIRDLAVQIEHALSYNEKQSFPFPINFINFSSTSNTKEVFLSRSSNLFSELHYTISDKNISSLKDINREDIIYLSPHAQDMMESFEWNKCYIIGGYVDKSSDHSQSTARLARILGTKCCRFPLDKYLVWGNISGRRELTIDTSFKILHTLRKTDNWAMAFKHIPRRFHRGLTELGLQSASRDQDLLEWYDKVPFRSTVKTPNPPKDRFEKYLSL